MTGTVFGEFAPLYDAASQRGFTPQAVDEMEIWQLASVLGLAREPDPTDRQAPQRDLIAERVAAARGEAPTPEPDAVDPGIAPLLKMTERA